MRSLRKLPVDGLDEFLRGLSVAIKVEDTSAACCWVLLPFKRHHCDKYIERKLSLTGNTLHVYVKEEEWELFIKVSLMEKRAKPNVLSFCAEKCIKQQLEQ